jgi:hypothetical protein
VFDSEISCNSSFGVYLLRRAAISSLSQDRNDSPRVELVCGSSPSQRVQSLAETYLERFSFEIAECNGLVKVGVVNALERANSLRSGSVVTEIVWDGTEILTMDQQSKKGQDMYLDIC